MRVPVCDVRLPVLIALPHIAFQPNRKARRAAKRAAGEAVTTAYSIPQQGTSPQPCEHVAVFDWTDDDDDNTPDATWKAGQPRHQPRQVYKNAQGRAKQKAYRGQAKRNHIPIKLVEYNACQAKHWKSTPSVLMGEAQR
jgi:hypothetical protein